MDLGVLFAIIALVSWGLGDFLIQRSTRAIGDWEALFVITFGGSLVLTPFILQDLPNLFSFGSTFWILLGVAILYFLASIVDFEALKQGKLAIVEPVLALEVPITVLLGIMIANETLTFFEGGLIFCILTGIVLVSVEEKHIFKGAWLEKGVFLAFFGAILMGMSNFFVGYASRLTNPLTAIWFLHLVLAVITAGYLVTKNSPRDICRDLYKHKSLVLSMTFFDNLAWIGFAYAVVSIPIGITIALTESYIALAALLGLLFNREVLKTHQAIGLVVTLIGAVSLSVLIG